MMQLKVITPMKRLCDCRVESISLPGKLSPFTILKGHAPIVSALERGTIRFIEEGGRERSIDIRGGFIKFSNDSAEICVEPLETK